MNLSDLLRSASIRITGAAILLSLGMPALAAKPEPPAVVAVQRIREGETITKDRLNVTPYLPTPSDASTFSRIDRIVGRVALKDIAEGSVVPRASVGAKPEEQFKITPATTLRVHATSRRGAVLPNAKQDYRQCQLDTFSLSADKATALREELGRSKVLLLPPDDFQIMEGGYQDYRLEISVDGVTRSLTWTGEQAPPEARRLVTKYLAECPTAAPELKVEFSAQEGDTGTMHYVDELRLSAGAGAPLVLASHPDEDLLFPFPGPQYPIGDHAVLLLGWSSTGAGMGSLQALLFHIDGNQAVLHRKLISRTDRWHTAWRVRRSGNAVWLGMSEATGPLHSEGDWYLDLGDPQAQRLDLDAMRKLAYVDVEKGAADFLYSAPMPLPAPTRVAWVVVEPDGVFLRDQPR